MAETTLTAHNHDDRSGPGLQAAAAWRRRAACRGLPGHVLYPATSIGEEQAKAICGACPVRAQCLDFAIEHDEPCGIWGGLNTEERRRVRRRRRAVATEIVQ